LTVAPAIGAPFWSLTRIDGAGETWLPAVPVSAVLELADIVVATEGSTGLSPEQAMYARSPRVAVILKVANADLVT
jgi:hypothetical protein